MPPMTTTCPAHNRPPRPTTEELEFELARSEARAADPNRCFHAWERAAEQANADAIREELEYRYATNPSLRPNYVR